jgi:hypothetical protein
MAVYLLENQMLCTLKNQGLTGTIEYHRNSYIVRVYRDSDIEKAHWSERPVYPFYVSSFGNGVRAEDRLLDLMEYPAWTYLKFG